MDQLQSALTSLGYSNPLKLFAVPNGPNCWLTQIDPVHSFEFWNRANAGLMSIGWHPVLMEREEDLSAFQGFSKPAQFSPQAKSAAPPKTANQQALALDEIALRVKQQLEEIDKITPAIVRRRFAEEAEGKHDASKPDFFRMTPARSKNMLQMSDADFEALIKQTKDGMKEMLKFAAGLSSVPNSLEELHTFENPHGTPSSATECIELGNSLDAIAWFDLKRKLEPRFNDFELGSWDRKRSVEQNLEVYSAKNPLALFVPQSEGYNVPSALGFIGPNDCPPPQVQTAILKRWHDLYSADLIFLGKDSLALFVPNPVTTEDLAVSIAKEQYVYNCDLVDQSTGFLIDLAIQILNAHVWKFWWD